ncbi:hypothetical protein [Dactylosporangium sp. NPDC051541]|uniref:hypothetical protein n=1 Tax=Dactylosporangium sp. NPDC051541 TaxID=3363977 RepID=UPI0037873223
MVNLLIYAGAADEHGPQLRTGGVPLAPAGFEWPQCRECGGAMQFQGQAPLDGGGLLSMFMCQNDPGLCDEWDATAGGNRAYLFGPDDLRPAMVPAEGATRLPEAQGATLEEVAGDDYFRAREEWAERAGQSPRQVLGQLGGEPGWLQGDETPACPSCDRPMSFVVQLEEGHEYRTAANYGGGGCAYGFVCRPCAGAAFLWQR